MFVFCYVSEEESRNALKTWLFCSYLCSLTALTGEIPSHLKWSTSSCSKQLIIYVFRLSCIFSASYFFLLSTVSRATFYVLSLP